MREGAVRLPVSFCLGMQLSGLYVITDRGLARGRSHEDVVEAALRGGAHVIQLRDKEASRAELLPIGRRLSQLCRDAGALFIVNDDPELARDCGAHGVHVGPTDMPPAQARAIVGPNAIVGWSIKDSVALARQAEDLGVSYVAIGSIYPTSTKEGASAVGLEPIRQVKQAVSLPIAAIGGINAGNAAEVAAAGAHMVCVISAAVAARDVEAACRELTAAIYGR
jgi:thiamine-phosphate diphosphorylase